jgi:hypothetical protein
MKCKDISLIGQVLLFQVFNYYKQKMAVIDDGHFFLLSLQ